VQVTFPVHRGQHLLKPRPGFVTRINQVSSRNQWTWSNHLRRRRPQLCPRCKVAAPGASYRPR
jgi:hypothetical protein